MHSYSLEAPNQPFGACKRIVWSVQTMDNEGNERNAGNAGKNKSRYLSGNGLYYLVLGNASWDSSKKKSCSKITLILISRRTSKLLRLKILYTFVRSQGICVANQAADLPCLLRISSMRFPMFILSTLNCLTHDYRMQRYEINLNISALYCRKCFLNTHLNSKAPPIVAFGC